MPPPSQRDEVVTVDFDVLAQDTMGFVRLSASTYARAAQTSGMPVVSYTIELALELPEDHRSTVAFFRGPDSFVRAIDFMRTALTRRPRILTSCLVPVAAAGERSPVAEALVALLGRVADEFDLDSDELSPGAKVLRLDEKLLKELVNERLSRDGTGRDPGY